MARLVASETPSLAVKVAQAPALASGSGDELLARGSGGRESGDDVPADREIHVEPVELRAAVEQTAHPTHVVRAAAGIYARAGPQPLEVACRLHLGQPLVCGTRQVFTERCAI